MACYSIGQNINKTHKISIVKTKLRWLVYVIRTFIINFLSVNYVAAINWVFELIWQLILVLCIWFFSLWFVSILSFYLWRIQRSTTIIRVQKMRPTKNKIDEKPSHIFTRTKKKRFILLLGFVWFHTLHTFVNDKWV